MAYECGSTAEDTKWVAWLDKCERIVGYSLQHIDDHSDLFDLYQDGCTPSEAVTEVQAQGA